MGSLSFRSVEKEKEGRKGKKKSLGLPAPQRIAARLHLRNYVIQKYLTDLPGLGTELPPAGSRGTSRREAALSMGREKSRRSWTGYSYPCRTRRRAVV